MRSPLANQWPQTAARRQLTNEGKERLRDTIVTYLRRGESKRGLPLFGGGLSLDFKAVLEIVHSRFSSS